MSVQTEIDRIITAVQAAHEKVAEKGGTTAAPYLVGNLASAIATIPEASAPTLQSKTVSPSTSAQTVKPDSGYDGLSQVTVNAMTTATQATPSISVDSAGKITASATQTAGYVAAGTKSATKQLTVQAAQTITPGTSNKTIASGRYLTGTQTIKGDSNLVAGNIKSGVSIFGVAGSYEGSGGSSGGASVETCTVTVNASALGVICYTRYSDGAIEACQYTMTTGDKSQNLVLTNVVCNSALTYLSGSYFMIFATTISGEGSRLACTSNSAVFATPSTSGASTVFKIYDDD